MKTDSAPADQKSNLMMRKIFLLVHAIKKEKFSIFVKKTLTAIFRRNFQTSAQNFEKKIIFYFTLIGLFTININKKQTRFFFSFSKM